MHAASSIGLPDPSSRRGRVACKLCGRTMENVKLRGHLRTEHRLDTASVEAQYLAAQMDVRKTRRAHP